jgi:hypothetical protein
MIPSTAIPPKGTPSAAPEFLRAVGVGVVEEGVCDNCDGDGKADPKGTEEDSTAKAPMPLGTTDGAGYKVSVM